MSKDQLIGFMIMKTMCNPEYMRDLVRRVVPPINEDSSKLNKLHVNLLKYMALIQKFMTEFCMPIPACDAFMRETITVQDTMPRCRALWERNRPKFSNLLLIGEDMVVPRSTQGIRIVHPLLAEIILEHLGSVLKQDSADMYLEFLKSPIMTSVTIHLEYVRNVCRDMIVCRLKEDYGDEKNTQFAPFIEDVHCHDQKTQKTKTRKALAILKEGFRIFRDPIVGQQEARLCKIRYKNLDEAEKAIDCAIKLSKELGTESSYIWDTKGLILQEKMAKLGQTDNISEPKRFDDREMNGILEVFMHAIDAFKEAQRVAENEKTQNYAGYINEALTIFKMLAIIGKRVKPFCFRRSGDEELVKYLCTDYIPEQLDSLHDHHELCKGLKEAAEAACSVVEEYINDCACDESAGQYKHLEEKLGRAYAGFQTYFTRPCYRTNAIDSSGSSAAAHEMRRSQVRAMRGSSPHNIFTMAFEGKEQTLKHVQKLLQANLESPKEFDVLNYISVSFALSVYFNENFNVCEIKRWVQKLKMMEDSRSGLYGLFFEMLLNWRAAARGRVCDPPIQETIEQLKRRWMNKYQGSNRENGPVEYSRGWSKPKVDQKLRPLKARTEFFLGKGGAQKFVPRRNLGRMDEKLWKSPKVTCLARVDGLYQDTQDVLYKPPNGDSLKIELALKRDTHPSRVQMEFYLGFSLAGPVAYDPGPKKG